MVPLKLLAILSLVVHDAYSLIPRMRAPIPMATTTPKTTTTPLPVCQTTSTLDNPNPKQNCVFPFNWNGTEYTKCTNVDFDDGFWCGTKLKITSNDGWGRCSEMCPNEATAPVPIGTTSMPMSNETGTGGNPGEPGQLGAQMEPTTIPIEETTIEEIDILNLAMDDTLSCVPIKGSFRNFLYAMGDGYDAGISNPYDPNGDPAIRNRIFLQDCPRGYYSFIGDVRLDMHCDSDFSLKAVTSEAGYNIERSQSNDFSRSVGGSAGGSYYGFEASVSAAYNHATNSEESAAMRVFTKYKGEIMMARATCLTNIITVSNFVRPLFTSDFINALKMLHAASLSDNNRTRETAFVQFRNEFGTHYMKKTSMGAELIYERRFTNIAKTTEDRKKRQGCVKDAARATVSGGWKSPLGSYGVSAGGNYSEEENACNMSNDDSKFEDSESSEVTKTISRGSRPKALADWVGDDFTPVPIHRVLVKISNLFRSAWLTKNDEYGFDQDLNALKIKDMFEEYMLKYCLLFMSPYLDGDCKPVAGVTNTGVDCWGRCGSKQGPCEWCGRNGMCCTRKASWKDTSNGCDGTFGGLKMHECIDPTSFVDCQWNEFGEWTKCSKPCGEGTQERTRTIRVKTEGGGKPCTGAKETRACQIKECPRWLLVGDKKECSGGELFQGKLPSVADCAAKCDGKTSMFAYGTNDYGTKRCDYGQRNGCDCYCETSATDDGECSQIDQDGFRLYKLYHSTGKACAGGDSCCSKDNKCNEDEGDCDSDAECHDGLKCGHDNCSKKSGQAWDIRDDCCYSPDCSGTCKTKGGNGCCVFPFKYNGIEYNGCTKSGSKNPWCAYAIDSSNVMTSWDYCADYCKETYATLLGATKPPTKPSDTDLSDWDIIEREVKIPSGWKSQKLDGTDMDSMLDLDRSDVDSMLSTEI